MKKRNYFENFFIIRENSFIEFKVFLYLSYKIKITYIYIYNDLNRTLIFPHPYILFSHHLKMCVVKKTKLPSQLLFFSLTFFAYYYGSSSRSMPLKDKASAAVEAITAQLLLSLILSKLVSHLVLRGKFHTGVKHTSAIYFPREINLVSC